MTLDISNRPAGQIAMAIDSGIARITISNPGRYNAMSLSMWQQLAQVVDEAGNSQEVRVLLLQGDGEKAFVSGADISEFGAARNSPEQIAIYGAAVNAAQQALSNSPKPVVAGIRGICMGGGIGMALACDLRYCTDNARFRMPAAKMGLGYDLEGIRRSVNILGAAQTSEIFFTARDFNGREAERMGMVQRCFSTEYFQQELDNIVSSIAANAPLTIQAAKLAIRHVIANPNNLLAAIVNQSIQTCFDSNDYKEGQLAFKEKRPPQFSGN